MNLSEQLLYEYVCVRVCVRVLLTDSFYNTLNTQIPDTLAKTKLKRRFDFG